jgi:hypothetical protein
VIAFGSAITGGEAYRRYAAPGVARASESDSPLLAFATVEPLARTYNLILDAARELDGLEALVLVSSHTEIVDPDFCAKVRRALADPAVGAVSATGANGVRDIAWWEGRVVCGQAVQRYEEHGGGELPAFSWTDHEPPPAEVEALDGQLLVLSPWAVHNLRFDETLVLNHGFEVDFSLQVREAGKRLMVVDLAVVHHRSLELVKDLDIWSEAHVRMAQKWNGRLGPAENDEAAWKRRARRAEAERESARAQAFSKALILDAHVLDLERSLQEKTSSLSWKLTTPLRTLNRIRREAAEQRNPTPSREGHATSPKRWD